MNADQPNDLFDRVRTFEWDNEKFEANLRSHEIDFRDARWIISGPTIVRRSDRQEEVRYMVFGFIGDKEVVVICTLRDEVCRLISARRARRDERKKYHSRLPRRPAEGQD